MIDYSFYFSDRHRLCSGAGSIILCTSNTVSYTLLSFVVIHSALVIFNQTNHKQNNPFFFFQFLCGCWIKLYKAKRWATPDPSHVSCAWVGENQKKIRGKANVTHTHTHPHTSIYLRIMNTKPNEVIFTFIKFCMHSVLCSLCSCLFSTFYFSYQNIKRMGNTDMVLDLTWSICQWVRINENLLFAYEVKYCVDMWKYRFRTLQTFDGRFWWN